MGETGMTFEWGYVENDYQHSTVDVQFTIVFVKERMEEKRGRHPIEWCVKNEWTIGKNVAGSNHLLCRKLFAKKKKENNDNKNCVMWSKVVGWNGNCLVQKMRESIREDLAKLVELSWSLVPFLAFPKLREGRAKDEKVLAIRHRDWTTPVLNGGGDGSSGDDDYEGDVPSDGGCWLQG